MNRNLQTCYSQFQIMQTTSFSLLAWLLESAVKLSTKATTWVLLLVFVFLILYIINEPIYARYTDILYILSRAFSHVNMVLFWAIYWYRPDLLYPDPTFFQTHILHTLPFILVCMILPYKPTTLVSPKDRHGIADIAVSIVTFYCVYVYCTGMFFDIWPYPLFSRLGHFFIWMCIHAFAWVVCLIATIFHYDYVVSKQPIQHAHQA